MEDYTNMFFNSHFCLCCYATQAKQSSMVRKLHMPGIIYLHMSTGVYYNIVILVLSPVYKPHAILTEFGYKNKQAGCHKQSMYARNWT